MCHNVSSELVKPSVIVGRTPPVPPAMAAIPALQCPAGAAAAGCPSAAGSAPWEGLLSSPAGSSRSDSSLSLGSSLADLAGDWSLASQSGRSSSVSLPASKLEQLQLVGQITPEAFAEVELGVVVGQGAWGTVHAGHWHGRQVAVKVSSLCCARSLQLGPRTSCRCSAVPPAPDPPPGACCCTWWCRRS
jgi:hypothetical protein